MYDKKSIWGILLVVLVSVPVFLLAQPGDDAAITFPPPVYVVGGETEIAGTANITGQVNYFIEYRPLDDDLQPRDGEDTLWIPATLPQRQPTRDGVLGVWDTTAAPDGLYAIRLTISREQGAAVHVVVSPVRVDNSAAEQFGVLDEDEAINSALLALTSTAQAVNPGGASGSFTTPSSSTTGSANATPTPALTTSTPTARVIVLANLRQGDSTLFAIATGLEPGDELTVLGRSTRGNNWLFVETADGERGWVAPSVVQLRGSILDIPEVNPPAPPVTRTPTPPPTPDLPDVVITAVEVDREIKEGEAFQIIVRYANNGSQYLPENRVFCNVDPMKAEVSAVGGNLQPGTGGAVAMPLALETGGNANITIICKVDMNDEVVEINEANNFGQITVFMAGR